MKEKMFLLIFLILIITVSILGESLLPIYLYVDVIEESQIPMPEVQYELPETLIGEFIMVSRAFNHQITIYPNNKFIAVSYIPGHAITYSYGHIININGTWYFSPMSRLQGYIRRLTEIFLTNTGFSFFLEGSGGLLRSMRKEDILIPENLTEEISVPSRTAKQQYFYFNNLETGRVEFNEIEVDPIGELWFFRLQIGNSIVRIHLVLKNSGGGPIVFEGFIEKTEENANLVRGIIRFTNGVPYYYINDGTAEIEIHHNGNIIITMQYSPDPLYMSETAKELQFPAKLVLEF